EIGIARGAVVARDDDVAAVGVARARARVMDEELAVDDVRRMKGETEEALLAAGAHRAAIAWRDVEEGRGEDLAILDDADPSALLDHEQAPRRILRVD